MMLCISLTGLKKFVSSSRKLTATSISEELGIETIRITPIETETIGFIIEAFSGETMILQHKFGKYKADLYFPEYNLIVECDENSHNFKTNKLNDIERQTFIESNFGCTFIRYRPHNDKNALAIAVNEIFRHILNHVNTT